MFAARLGSLNALEQTRRSRSWPTWVGGKLPSADTMGRVFTSLSPEDLRAANRDVYTRLKRNKALQPFWHGLTVLVLDGHESHSSYLTN